MQCSASKLLVEKKKASKKETLKFPFGEAKVNLWRSLKGKQYATAYYLEMRPFRLNERADKQRGIPMC